MAVSCPFCNALLEGFTLAVGSRGVPCPRCGALVPGVMLMTPQASKGQRQRRALSSMRRTVIIGVGLGIAGIIAGVVWQWATPKPPPQVIEPPEPVKMAGLGYLPQNTDMAIGFRTDPLISATPTGQPLNLARFGIPADAGKWLETTLGLPLSQVDQVTIGVPAKTGALLTDWLIVVHLRRPMSLETLLKARQGKSQTDSVTSRTFGRVSGKPLDWWLWLPHPEVLLVAVSERALREAPAEARPTTAHLSASLQKALEDRIPKDAAAWGFATANDWDKLLALPLGLAGSKGPVRSFAELRSVTLFVPADESILNVTIETPTNFAAETMRGRVVGAFSPEERIIAGGAGATVFVRLPTTAEAVQKVFGLLFPGKE